MKKTLLILAAVAMVFGMAMNAGAASTVSVTLTSPTITKAVAACEKAGAVTFSFPQGSVLTAGDWWYMDLPEGATLCKAIDYLIVGDSEAGGTADHYVYADTTLPTSIVFKAAASERLGNIAVDATGPLTTVNLGGVAAATVVTGNLAIRVIGAAGSRRVTLYVASDVANAGTITVQSDNQLDIKILDGAQWKGAGGAPTNNRIITNVTGSAYAAADGTTTIGSKWAVFGQTKTDNFPAAANRVTIDEYIGSYPANQQVPFVENTLCVNAEKASGNLFVSFASLNDKFTFTGDSQIAHTGTPNTITLGTCVGNKVTVNDKLPIVSGQGTCGFEYETHSGYCVYSAASPNAYSASIYLMSDTVFGELNDLYDIVVKTKTAGVYFSATNLTMKGLTSGQKLCTAGVGTDITPAAGNLAWTAGMTAGGTNCTVGATNKVDMIYSYGGALHDVQNYKYMTLDLPTLVYDNSVVVAGTEVNVQVTLQKYPCGQIFSDTVTIGTFVATCTTATPGSTTLLYPYMIGSKYTGWFAGFVVTNGSTKAGVATLTAVDDNGNKATFDTPEIPAMGSFNASFLTVADWKQDAGNTANFDMTENFVVKVVCKFEEGGGMAFLGNMTEGYAIGYDAYSSAW